MKAWRLRCDEFLPMTTTSASDGTSLPRFSEVKLKARLFVRACLCCKIVRQQNLRWSVKFVSSDYLKDMVGKCCDILPVVWGLWSGEQHISCWAPSSWQRLTKTAKKCQKRGGAERGGLLLVQQTQMETEELGRGSASYHRPAQIFERHQATTFCPILLKTWSGKRGRKYTKHNIPLLKLIWNK